MRGYAGPTVESGPLARLTPGQTFHFTDHFRGGAAPEGLPRSSDGRWRIVLGDARQPALCAPAPYVFRQKLWLPAGAKLRTAFGMGPGSSNKRTAVVHFTVRLRQNGKTKQLLSGEVSKWRGGDTPNWAPATVALPAGNVEIELATEIVGEARPGRPEASAVGHALWVDPVVFVPATRSRPNILLVVIDDLRADHLGCYGYRRGTSPFIDSLASRSVLFSEATSQATATMPSIRGLLTSTYQLVGVTPSARELQSPAGGEASFRQPVTMPVSLQGELRKAGYETLACVGGGYLDPVFGFDAGFDWYWSPSDTTMLRDQIPALKERLQRITGGPFFLLLHTYEVHHYHKGWGHELSRFGHGYTGRLTDPRQLAEAVHAPPRSLTAADLQYIRDLYDGEIRCTDRHLKLFFDWLLAQPWAENTAIVITADHGEALGEHGVMMHGGAPYREVARVPLIIHLPRGRWRGRRIEQPVSLADVTPSLLELAGVSSSAEMVGDTLLPFVNRRQGRARPVLCGSQGALMARDGPSWYLSWRGERPEELYQAARDPRQQHSIARSSPGELARMRGVLADLVMQAPYGYRLVAAGPRKDALTIELESTTRFTYFDVPTAQRRDALEAHPVAVGGAEAEKGDHAPAGQRATIRLAAGNETHVILFELADQKATISVAARLGATPVEPARFHLGKSGASPQEVPLVLGPAARALLSSDRPPVAASAKSWGIWLWLPPGAAEATQSQVLEPEKLPETVKNQLRSLGYLR